LNERLSAELEVAGLIRRAQSMGGFGAVIRRGDPDRGELLVQVAERGESLAMLERRLTADFTYRWTRTGAEAENLRKFVADRERIDPDFWLIELDIADAERFVAEMTAMG